MRVPKDWIIWNWKQFHLCRTIMDIISKRKQIWTNFKVFCCGFWRKHTFYVLHFVVFATFHDFNFSKNCFFIRHKHSANVYLMSALQQKVFSQKLFLNNFSKHWVAFNFKKINISIVISTFFVKFTIFNPICWAYMCHMSALQT